MYPRKSSVSDVEPRPGDLAENGHEVLAWRVVRGTAELVAVEIGFTIAGLEGEEFVHFRERMLRFAKTLGLLGHPVIGLTFQRRKANNRRHWAEFVCRTPGTALPVPLTGCDDHQGE